MLAEVTDRLTVRLRRETRTWHTAVEQAVDLMREQLVLDDYRRIVARLYGFYAPWEAALEPWSGVCFSEAAISPARCPVLLRDLHTLDVDPALVPVCSKLPDIRTRAHALGSFYVREGAALGGQFIARHLEAVLNFSGGRGYQFFRGCGCDTGRMWRAFQELLTSTIRPEQEQQLVDAANETFQCIYVWMREANL
jgi:heme oxygenase